MRNLLALATVLLAGCDNTAPPMDVAPRPCGSVGPMGMTVSAYACNAVSISTQTGATTRIIVTSSTMDGDDLRVGSVTVDLKGLLHDMLYKPGDPTVLSYSSTVTRVSDGAGWTLAYDAGDASKTQGSLMLAVKMFQPDSTVAQELDLHGHLTASYVGQTPLTLDVDY